MYDLTRRSTRASAVALSPESPKRSAPILALARRPPRPRRAATQPAALGWRMQQPGVVAHAIGARRGVTCTGRQSTDFHSAAFCLSYCTATRQRVDCALPERYSREATVWSWSLRRRRLCRSKLLSHGEARCRAVLHLAVANWSANGVVGGDVTTLLDRRARRPHRRPSCSDGASSTPVDGGTASSALRGDIHD